MASCLVPDFPAVLAALEHLKELDKQLKEERVSFSPEASLHLTEITAAVTELEADRRAAHEHLEVETIENSKLRHQINNLRERMSQEIMADVAAARASNAEEIEELHKDLHTVSQLQEATVRRQEVLQSQNEELCPQREQVKAEHEEIIAAQNEQITVKYGLQMQLDRTRDQIEELESCIAAVGQETITLQQKMVVEREAVAVKKENLTREVDQVEEKIKQEKQTIRSSRRELNLLNDKKQEAQDRLSELMFDVANLEGNARRMAESRSLCEKHLQAETQKHQELKLQRETLKKELLELGEAFKETVKCLKEEIGTVESRIKQGRTSRLQCQNSLAQIYEVFKHQREEENEVKVEYFYVSQQLERSKLQLEERIASIVKHGKQIKEMDKQIAELREVDTITKRVFERNQEELSDNMDTEKKNISQLEEEKSRLTWLLEEETRKQEEHVEKMTSEISSTRRRYQELREEEAALQKRQPKSVDANLLISHTAQCEEEFRQKETKRKEEIEKCTLETESIMRSNEEKQREVEEEEEMLKEVEAKWNEEQTRNKTLKALTSDLRRKRSDLERSIEVMKEETVCLLQPKDEMKEELEEMRKSYMEVLDKQASELRAVEVNVYDNSVKLEQVGVENSRLRLRITQMKEEVRGAGEDRDRYRQEVQQFKQDIQDLVQGLQDAWREDSLVSQDGQSRDGVLLVSMGDMLDQLKTRRQQLGRVCSLLHQHMLNFSRRLGDKSIEST
ncbi:trichohyalin [Centropristis striata]|uniref:trichohyalin n=1 Tax=Centropristis striata TaxID=184440 RepID=UPI0027E14ACD|nr:trichohyalin [Centropristis striata]